ncbi:Hypothetical predicted protein [Paramuricea clavata]|uniref:Uncharacterized protein n=1 Tax=Paramuricea clavata TaxID=317549 RepID=A0A7D9K3I3_PARCT|nr:Hypothetical predicted protein [Paramuricea clavata]
MEIECSSEEGTKNETQAEPPLPCMDGLPETNSGVENSNCVNGSPLNSIKNGEPNVSKNGEPNVSKNGQPSPEPAKNGLPPSQSPKGSGTLFRFFSPVTPGSKTTTVEHSKTPSKDDGKTPSKDDGRTPSKDDGRTPSKDSGDVVGSPCTPINTKTSPGGSANGETPNPGTVSSSGMKTTTPRRNTPGRKLSVEEKLKREEERVRKQKEKVIEVKIY